MDNVCQEWMCGYGMSSCSRDMAYCIQDQKICDRKRDCPNGEDEIGMITNDGVDIKCGIVGNLCKLYKGNFPGAKFKRGAFCKNGNCVNRRLWCDGQCDCSECEDEEKCEKWECEPEMFKCSINNICVRQNSLCDGKLDCGSGDK